MEKATASSMTTHSWYRGIVGLAPFRGVLWGIREWTNLKGIRSVGLPAEVKHLGCSPQGQQMSGLTAFRLPTAFALSDRAKALHLGACGEAQAALNRGNQS